MYCPFSRDGRKCSPISCPVAMPFANDWHRWACGYAVIAKALAQLADEMQSGTPEWDNLRINEYQYEDLELTEEDIARDEEKAIAYLEERLAGMKAAHEKHSQSKGDAPEADRPTEGEAL
jgi:hypothetical protein